MASTKAKASPKFDPTRKSAPGKGNKSKGSGDKLMTKAERKKMIERRKNKPKKLTLEAQEIHRLEQESSKKVCLPITEIVLWHNAYNFHSRLMSSRLASSPTSPSPR